MAAVFDGLISSRRRPARSHSESGKQLHARWGDSAITAPNDGGWSQHYLEDDINNIVYQAHGSPDSQKTLVNESPDLSYKDDIEKISIEEIRQPMRQQTPPLAQRERGAITFTIPLPWGRRSHRRSSSGSKHQAQAAQVVEKVITAESRPALNLTTSIDEVMIADPRTVGEAYRAVSPIVQTQSPVYDDISTFFTRAVFPEKHGPRSLPQIQTQVPINKSQPASALSILSPVAEKYDGISESNNATPMDNTPIAQRRNSALPIGDDGVIDVSVLASRLETYSRNTPASVPLPPSRVTSPVQTPIERPDSRSTARFPSRPQSRGPGIGEVAYMRASSRGPTEGHRSASRDAVGRRNPSVEPLRRRAMSRDAERRRADSPRGMSGRAYSREAVGERARSREPRFALAELDEPRVDRALSLEPVRPRAESPGPVTRRARSRESSTRRGLSPVGFSRRAVSREPAIRREVSPVGFSRRAVSREPAIRREVSPVGFSRRAVSREPATRRRVSGEFARRAASVDPIRRRASPRDDIIPRHTTPLELLKKKEAESSDSSSAEELTADDTTDIETETDEMYFESRKGWNGPAMKGADSKGFYGDVINDYKLIARDVEVEQIQSTGAKPRIELINYIKKDKLDVETFKETKKYGGPDLVPDQEDLWG